jgi:mRNA interferase MazF
VTRPKRGEIYWLDWNPARGSEQAGRRRALVIQNDQANVNERYPNKTVVAVSTKGRLRPDGTPISTHVRIEPDPDNGLADTSFAKCEQIQTVAKARLQELIGRIDVDALSAVEIALRTHLAIWSTNEPDHG